MRRISGGFNICVLASGEGSNLNSILKASSSGKIKSRVAAVLSNNSGSGALKIARQNKVTAIHLSQKLFKSDNEFVNTFLILLKQYKIDLIVLAGYMKMLGPPITRKYKNRIINIHPALLPSFGGKGMYGINVHKAVLESGEKITGATVHYVDDKYDNGKIIIQKQVKIFDGDTPEKLQKRVLRAEHKLYPEAIKILEEKQAGLKTGRMKIIK